MNGTKESKEKLSRLTQFYATPTLFEETQRAAAELGLEMSAYIRMALTKENRRVLNEASDRS